MLALTKILVDSINEKRLVAELDGAKEGEKGISKLERFLDRKGVPELSNWIGFLRDLQELRSSGVAHRKGKKYDEVSGRFDIGDKDLSKVFEDILVQATDMIQALSTILPPEKG